MGFVGSTAIVVAASLFIDPRVRVSTHRRLDGAAWGHSAADRGVVGLLHVGLAGGSGL